MLQAFASGQLATAHGASLARSARREASRQNGAMGTPMLWWYLGVMVIEQRPFAVPTALPDLRMAWDVVSPKVRHAAIVASKRLDELGIKHALIAGVAVGAHGAARATKDVGFLLRQDEAFQGDAILSFRQGVPIAIDGVSIDYLTPEGNEFPELTGAALDAAIESEGIRVVPLSALILLKLQAGRRQDHEDVARLLSKARVEAEVRQFLRANAPGLEAELDFAMGGQLSHRSRSS